MYVYSHMDSIKMYKKDKKNSKTGTYLGNHVKKIYHKKNEDGNYIKENNRYYKVKYNSSVGQFVIL